MKGLFLIVIFPSFLSSHGGHIDIAKSWAQSLLLLMRYVKSKCSTSGKISMHILMKVKRSSCSKSAI